MYIFEGDITEITPKKDTKDTKDTTDANPSGKKYKLTRNLRELYSKRRDEIAIINGEDVAKKFTHTAFIKDYEKENIKNTMLLKSEKYKEKQISCQLKKDRYIIEKYQHDLYDLKRHEHKKEELELCNTASYLKLRNLTSKSHAIMLINFNNIFYKW
jgi:hypothetical protein